MSKIKTFLTDSQPGYVLKILVNPSVNVVIKKVSYKKKKVLHLAEHILIYEHETQSFRWK